MQIVQFSFLFLCHHLIQFCIDLLAFNLLGLLLNLLLNLGELARPIILELLSFAVPNKRVFFNCLKLALLLKTPLFRLLDIDHTIESHLSHEEFPIAKLATQAFRLLSFGIDATSRIHPFFLKALFTI